MVRKKELKSKNAHACCHKKASSNPWSQTYKLIDSQQCINRMEIASIKRFAFIRKARSLQDNQQRAFLFFSPTEELHGRNIFSKMSHCYTIVRPYIEMIDTEFIEQMNHNANNIAMYVNPDCIIMNG